jgi:Ras homolog enriched in brain
MMQQQDEYSILNSKHFIGIHGYMIVYSVGSRQSFEMVRNIHEKILNHLVSTPPPPPLHCTGTNPSTAQGADEVPIMLVANKSDIKPELRKVSPPEGEALARDMKCGFTEASARLNENVALAFELMIAQIERSVNPNEPTGGGKCAVM